MRYNCTATWGNFESGLVNLQPMASAFTSIVGGGVYYEITGEISDFILELIDEFAQGESPSGI